MSGYSESKSCASCLSTEVDSMTEAVTNGDGWARAECVGDSVTLSVDAMSLFAEAKDSVGSTVNK